MRFKKKKNFFLKNYPQLFPIIIRPILLRFKSKNSMFALLFKIIRMYAIVDIAGKQFKVEKNKFLYAPLMDAEAGTSLNFPQVLLTDDDGKVKVGTPSVKGSSVSGKILEHVRGDKVIVFKKKRRKGYRVKKGHRQQFTKILIEDIK
jgi:large subunit ribosomal protein L21